GPCSQRTSMPSGRRRGGVPARTWRTGWRWSGSTSAWSSPRGGRSRSGIPTPATCGSEPPRSRQPSISSMHEALTGLLDSADLAMAAVRDVVEDVGSVAPLVNDARLRLDHPEDTIVAALAGG